MRRRARVLLGVEAALGSDGETTAEEIEVTGGLTLMRRWCGRRSVTRGAATAKIGVRRRAAEFRQRIAATVGRATALGSATCGGGGRAEVG
jgi:hypothetical protein